MGAAASAVEQDEEKSKQEKSPSQQEVQEKKNDDQEIIVDEKTGATDLVEENVRQQEREIRTQANPNEKPPVKKSRPPKKNDCVLTADEIVIVMHFFALAIKNEKSLKGIREKIPRLFYKMNLVENHILFPKGSVVDGLYFIQQGSIKLMSSTDPSVCVAEILPGQFYGDMEVLYDKPAAMTAVVASSTSVLFLPARRLRPLMSSFDTNMEDWCVTLKHLPNHSDIQYDIWREKLITCTLPQVPVFDGWSDASLLDLAGLLPYYPVSLYLPNSLIMREGDPSDRLLILVKGRISVFSGENFLTTVTAFTLPFPIGEEGFCSEKDMSLTVKATEPCHIMRVERAWVQQAVSKNETCQQLWEDVLQSWQSITLARDEKLTTKFSSLIQVEIIYKWLRDTGNFTLCPPKCVYRIAQSAQPKEFKDVSFEDTSLALLLILDRPTDSMSNVGKIKSTIFVSPRRPLTVSQDQEEDILVLWFDVATVTRIVRTFPGAKLTLK